MKHRWDLDQITAEINYNGTFFTSYYASQVEKKSLENIQRWQWIKQKGQIKRKKVEEGGIDDTSDDNEDGLYCNDDF